MSTEVTLPPLGESVSEGTVSRWLKQVGDHVDADEALLEVSTDKVDTEVPSPVAGTLLEIKVNENDVAEVGAVLAVIGEAGEAPVSAPEPTPQVPTSTPEPEPQAETPASGGASTGTEIVLPALGESVTEGTVSRWLKQVGDSVEADEAILEVSTDKVDTEVPSPVAGTLLEIRIPENEIAQVGAVLAIVGDKNVAPAPKAEPVAATPATPAPQASAPATPAPATPATEEPKRVAESPVPTPYVTPLVRKLAKELEVDLNSIKGTGIGGRIRKDDVIAAGEAKKQATATSTLATSTTTQPATPAPSAKAGTVEKMSRVRQVVATRMPESLKISAQLTGTVEVDFTAISKLRAKVKDDFRAREGAGLTYLAFIAKAVTEGLRTFPALNSTVDMEAKTINYQANENIGIAVDTPKGLFVPVIAGAGDLTVGGLAKKIGELAKKARDGKLTGAEMTGGTFTITNYGSAGTLFDTPIINQPEVAILGTGALVKRPVVVTDQFGNDTIAIRDMMYLSLTYDHRVVDGADAGRFLAFIKERLEAGQFAAEFGI